MTKLLFFRGIYKRFPALCSPKFGISFILAIIPVFQLFSQQIEINGKILDENTSEPIIGATVRLKNSQTATITNISGAFTLKAKSFPAVLSITSTGYKKQEVDVYEGGSIDIRLVENIERLNEVVVVGYGTQKRKELTGSVASVSKSHLEYNVASSVDALLGGAVAGVNVTQSSGQPGSPASIRIRGGNSINASNDPLYVIDGFL